MSERTADPAAKSPASWKRRVFVAIPVVAFAALAVLLYGRLFSGNPSTLPSALIGRPAPDLTLPAIAGLTANGAAVPGFSRADLVDGEVTVVNVFGSWCGPCREEHPALMDLAKSGVRMVGLNYKDNPENARRFLGGLGNPFSRVGVDPNGRAAIEWGVYGVPETFVVDGKGNIAFKQVGPILDAAARAKVLAEIEKAKANE